MEKQSLASLLLPAPQFKESHDLAVDPESIGAEGATVVAPPYQAMSVGDLVTLTFAGYFGEDDPWTPYIQTKTLAQDDVGNPLTWPRIPKNEVAVLIEGFAHLSYSIVYATPTVPTESVTQTVNIITPPDTLLPAPQIKGFSGDELDPDVYPDGIILEIEQYAGIQVGDDVMLYATSDTSVIKTVRVDSSTIDSKILEIRLEYAWLSANNGKAVSFMYQYARPGHAGTSELLTLNLRKPLILPMPNVKDATPDGDGKGFLLANRITGGVYIEVPEEANIGEGDKVQMHWQGYGASGSYIADHTVGDAARYYIPATAVPANIGKRLSVFYKVTPPGKDSKSFDLEIRDLTSGMPTLQIKSPPSPSNEVSLAAATNGVVFRLGSWPYMGVGQRLKIEVEGLLSTGEKETFGLRTGDAEVVTDAEYYAGELQATLPRNFLLKLKLNEQLNVSITVSFDDGFTYKRFPWISPKLVA